MEWLQGDAPRATDCEHRPDLYGRHCELCGMTADPRPVRGSAADRQDREDFARALEGAYVAAVARAEGQTEWLA
jgi:hypothetical protein